ncbi:uncharacterized protein N7446_005479 [Penicillium canescens]|uniref:FAD/NAD(P)-binding domain-containing protein n=1 Tax=Penicillium canescens TaxID=5083 RepID=A0AAD6IIT6_PENCN|nr:uncharacterized protein N7446_005479 [Penicillium canescens]KAJ6050283.1 hypothetical protein N7444_006999 [Penicillium canescens]KAJ6050854.1 hypothetical protein N7460_001388 [Penicillium canescens]KAJ6061359.1 hypothetical protein N7446_005479 [Penicillium canescens]
MVKSTALLSAFFSLLASTAAVTVPDTDYDVIVVGGGPAGLSALSGVSRVRRTALLIDSGHYRNDPTREMHDVIGNDGTPPAKFRSLAREQILQYDTATIEDDTVETIDPIGGGDFSSFNVKITNGTTYTARKIVLGTGVYDILPDTPGLKEGFGKGIWWCPWCDGYEHRDQPFGMIGDISDMLSNVLEVHTLYSDMIAFVNGTQTPEGEARAAAKVSDWKEQLEAWGTKIDNRTIASIERLQDGGKNRSDTEHAQYDKFRVHFTTGEPVERNAFIINVPTAQYSSLPTQMGLDMAGGKINVTSGMRTSEAGVFAVGDANSDGSTNVPHAMFSGKKAAVYLHVEMSREESKSKVSKREGLSRRELEKEADRAIGDNLDKVWERVLRM